MVWWEGDPRRLCRRPLPPSWNPFAARPDPPHPQIHFWRTTPALPIPRPLCVGSNPPSPSHAPDAAFEDAVDAFFKNEAQPRLESRQSLLKCKVKSQ